MCVRGRVRADGFPVFCVRASVCVHMFVDALKALMCKNSLRASLSRF